MEKFINNIFEIIVEILPSNWEKLVLHMSLLPGVQSMYFFVKGDSEEKYYSYYDLQAMDFFSEGEYRSTCLAIGQESFELLKTFPEPWTGYTLVIDRDGTVNMDYEYYEQPINIPDSWKQKYLI